MSMQAILICYLAISVVLFFIGIMIGKVFKKDILHGKVMLGVINSTLLSVVWPMVIVLCILGWLYDAIQVWKKL